MRLTVTVLDGGLPSPGVFNFNAEDAEDAEGRGGTERARHRTRHIVHQVFGTPVGRLLRLGAPGVLVVKDFLRRALCPLCARWGNPPRSSASSALFFISTPTPGMGAERRRRILRPAPPPGNTKGR